MSRRPTCHPDRPALGNEGLCRTCYHREWRRRKMARIADETVRPCEICGNPIRATDPRKIYCGEGCCGVACDVRRSAHRGEEMHVTPNRYLAERLAAAYIARGCKRVGSRANGTATKGAYVAAWKRGRVYLVRARLPEEYLREEAA